MRLVRVYSIRGSGHRQLVIWSRSPSMGCAAPPVDILRRGIPYPRAVTTLTHGWADATHMQLASILPPLWLLIILFTKFSILLQYLRIFIPNRGKTYYLVHWFIWTNNVFFLLQFVLVMFQCIPRRKIWEPFLPGHCIDWRLDLIITSVFNLISDLIVLLLPFVWIWRLHMSWRRKIGVSAIFMIGIW